MRAMPLLAATLLVACGLTLDFDPRPDGGKDAGGVRIDGAQLDAGRNDPCRGRPEGAECVGPTDQPSLCIGGRCVVSTCGDGFIDDRIGEECESVDASCIGCHFACHAPADCLSGGPLPLCVLSVSCLNNACVPVFEMDGRSCMDGNICRGGRCVASNCGDGIVTPPEECDEPDTTAGDGCEPDCQFSCHDDSACDDRNVCNGLETCGAVAGGAGHACVAGDPVPVDACFVCDATAGPVIVDVDGDGVSANTACAVVDCDDSNALVHPGATEVCDGIDNNCDGNVDEDLVMATAQCYLDADHDGYPSIDAVPTDMMCTCTATVRNCTCDGGRVMLPLSPTGTPLFDCLDSNANVHPNQTMFFATPYCTACPAPYDYDCNGAQEHELTGSIDCGLLSPGLFCRGSGWRGSEADCGVRAPFDTCGGVLGLCGVGTSRVATQRCR